MQETPWGEIPTHVNKKRFKRIQDSIIPEEELWRLPPDARQHHLKRVWERYITDTIRICDDLANKLKSTKARLIDLRHKAKEQGHITGEAQREAKRVGHAAALYYTRMITEGCIVSPVHPSRGVIPHAIKGVMNRGLLDNWSLSSFGNEVDRAVTAWELNRSKFYRLLNRIVGQTTLL